MSRETSLSRTEPQSIVQSDNRPAYAPPCDIYENAEEILLLADLPGVANDAVQINFEKGELSVDARRELPKRGSVLAQEFRDCDYRRRFSVPTGIDASKISAEVKEGVLRLHLPKSEGLKPRQISVKAG